VSARHEPVDDAVKATIDRNVAALVQHDQQAAARAGVQDKIADRITVFAGSMTFVYVHLIAFGGWIAANVGVVPGIPAWDPTMVILAMVASVEAIFVSAFVLISQNRMALISERRSQLNLQISLLAEHETKRLMALVTAIAERLDVQTSVDEEVKGLLRDVQPDAVIARIEDEEKKPPTGE
jgi:uncharacterized membrane protein